LPLLSEEPVEATETVLERKACELSRELLRGVREKACISVIAKNVVQFFVQRFSEQFPFQLNFEKTNKSLTTHDRKSASSSRKMLTAAFRLTLGSKQTSCILLLLIFLEK